MTDVARSAPEGAPSEGNALFIYVTQVSDQLREVLSPLPREIVTQRGLTGSAIAGVFTKPAPKHGAPPRDSFWENPDYVAQVHEVVRAHAPRLDALRATASRQGDGWVYVLDERGVARPEVLAEDVIGGFPVRSGRIDDAGYEPNPGWRVLGQSGTARLPPPLHRALVERLSSGVA